MTNSAKPAKHGRDHCPGGADPIPCLPGAWPWIVLVNNGQTLASGTAFVPSHFDEVYWDSSLTSNPTSGGGTFFVSSVLDSGTNYWQLYLNSEGWYRFEIVHSIDDLSGGAAGEYFQQRISQSAGTPFAADDFIGSTAEWAGTGGSEMDVQAWIETHRTIWAADGNVQRMHECSIRQNSGASKGVQGHVKVWYLGGVGGSTNNADWNVATA